MNTPAGPHLACYHVGYDFDWWRCNTDGYVGRPPSPFPASFETPRVYRGDSADSRHGIRVLAGTPMGCGCERHAGQEGQTNGDSNENDAARKLYWPLCQGPELPDPADDLGDMNFDDGLSDSNKKKTPRLPQKRPPWCPAKLPNKWGLAGHPPPYTNYCKETLFNTRKADPSKITIKTTF